MMAEHTYKDAGVDIEAANMLKSRIKAIASPTHGPQVMEAIGSFGAMYHLAGYRDPVLVSSTDGVGTKLKIAAMMDNYDHLGKDLVNACINDIIVCAATPLFFLDYVSVGDVVPGLVETLLEGMASACSQVGCALVGGETAQMPGIYPTGGFDLAGFALGVVERSEMLNSSAIREGDILIGIPSNGLHSNGYSLVRRILNLDEDPAPLREFQPQLGRTLGEALLEPHRSYYEMVRQVFPMVKAMAHITGGGLIENVPRVLPEGLTARLDTTTWEVPHIFTFLQQAGNVVKDEMYRVFNMGLGIVVVCQPSKAGKVVEMTSEARVVGEVVKTQDRRCVLV